MTEQRLNLIECELKRLNNVFNDLQMQINTLKMEFENDNTNTNKGH